MEKAEFIEKAPAYYALAIISELLKGSETTTHFAIVEAYWVNDEDSYGNGYSRIEKGRLFDLGLEILTKEI